MTRQLENFSPQPPSPEALPTQTYALDRPVYIREGLRPMGMQTFIGSNGEPIQLPLLATIDVPGQDRVALTQRTVQGRDVMILAQVHPRSDGSQEVVSSKGGYKQVANKLSIEVVTHNVTNPETGNVTSYTLERGGEGGNYSWRLSSLTRTAYAPGVGAKLVETKPILTLHADQATRRRGKSGQQREWQRQTWRERRIISKKLIVGVLAVKAVIGTGGVIDMVGDGFNRAHDTVYGAIPVPHRDILHLSNNWRDGTSYADAPKGAMAKDQAAEDRIYSQEVHARDAVAKVMDQLDGHDYVGIRNDADNFYHAHQNEILSPQQVEGYEHAVNNASNTKEVVKVLQDFTANFGLTAGLQQEDDSKMSKYDYSNSLDLLKSTAHTLIAGLGWLPKELIRDSRIEQAEIGGSEEIIAFGNAGDYSPYEGAVKLHIDEHALSLLLAEGEDFLTGADSSQPGALAHELGHALAFNDPTYGEQIQTKEVNGDKHLMRDDVEQVLLGGLLDYPSSISTYSRKDDDERIAEDISGVLSSRTDGLAHPDDWRRFNSPANKELLRVLDVFEDKYPGIAAYIVAHNTNLMRDIP